MKKNSKTLAYILRHDPASIGTTLDENGWCAVQNLEMLFTIKELENIVDFDSKGRYEFNCDKTKIRATYGHSVSVEIDYMSCTPPQVLYHGTSEKYRINIEKEGLIPRSRLFVHLSQDIDVAIEIGKRHGNSIVYEIDCKMMSSNDCLFYRAGNGIWLTNNVPVKYLKRIM